jgi:quinol monooxygenase YgiN
MAQPVLVFATFRPAAGKEQALLDTLAPMLEHTRTEAGNEVYDLYRSEGEGGAAVFHLFERYVDQDALQFHREAEYYLAYRAALGDILASPVEVLVLSEVDVA